MSEKLYQDFRAAAADAAYRTGGPAALSDLVDTGCCHRKDSGSKSNTKRQYSGLPETAAIRKSTSCQDYKL